VSAHWRRSRVVPGGQRRRPTPSDAAPPAAAAPASDAISAETIEHLLDDMRGLRLTFVADLSAAAAAVEADSEHVAAEIVESDRQELMAFLRRSTGRLEGEPVPAPASAALAGAKSATWRRRVAISLPAVPLVGALAMSAAAAAGLLPLPTHHSSSPHARVLSEGQLPVSTTFQQFESVLAGDPSASQVVAAASALHRQIAALIASAPQNPAGVNEVAKLLQLEQALLMRKQPPGSKFVLAQSRKLAAQLQTVATHATTQPTPASVPTSSSSTHKTSSPKPTSSPSASSKPSAKPSSKPSSTPSSSPSSSDAPGHIPTIGG